MKNIRIWSLVAFAAVALAACGGGGDGDQSPRIRYSTVVSFGDSLSDVGTYATVALKAATGGGKYTVNGPQGKNWTELLAAQAQVPAPCAAQTGLEASGPFAALAEATVNHPNCFGYAQGGSRVTNPVGVANKALLAAGDNSGLIGQLTDPVINQINRHLAVVNDKFSGTELVTVMAGGNDVFLNLAGVSAAQQAPTQAVTAMGAAGAELAAYVKTLIVAKGAKHVVVVNLPDVSQTPLGYSLAASVQPLVQQMSITFNTQLKAGLENIPEVLYVDAFAQGQDQVAHPETYALTNVTTPACNLTPSGSPGVTLFASSLVCTSATLVAGDVSHYEFADSVHPTPFAYELLARFVAKRMIESGWL